MLNPRQEKFCLEYSRTGNATQAYKAAGYEVKSDGAAQANSSRLLADDRIQSRLKELSDEIKDSTIADVRELQERLTSIVRGEVTTSTVTKEGEILTIPVSMKDKLKAAELILKTHGAFVTKQELNMSEIRPVVIIDNVTE